ncbi:MAG: ribonuclease D [Planktomarina sp.]
MKTITTTSDLSEFCAQAKTHPFVTVDTEFLRERTYYSKLCLVQLAFDGDGENDAVLLDPLADGIDLAPLYDLFRDTSVVKVFHAARQDLEIFWHEGGVIPMPLFDTQVAAMVCGFGEQVGYQTLVRKIAKGSVDKSSRFTDWSRRPLSSAQERYALADVTHLRQIYTFLQKELDRTGRAPWMDEELAILCDPATYVVDPDEAWRRVRTRTTSGKFVVHLKELAAFRERHAQTRNIPRNRVFKDDALVELASTKPKDMQDLGKSRLLLREARKGDIAAGILDAIARAGATDPADYPALPAPKDQLQVNPALADLLRVLVKAKADEFNVAQKMLATAAELDAIAAGKRDLPAFSGWRNEVFGTDAARLCAGELGLVVKGQKVRVFEI